MWAAPNGREALAALVRYVLLAQSAVVKQELVEMFRDTVDPAAQEVVMTVGEQLIAQGRAEGQAQGRAEGRAESILTVLRARGLEVSDAARTRILACADTTMLEQWLARAVSCASVEELVD